jgi:hypothetical protein
MKRERECDKKVPHLAGKQMIQVKSNEAYLPSDQTTDGLVNCATGPSTTVRTKPSTVRIFFDPTVVIFMNLV